MAYFGRLNKKGLGSVETGVSRGPGRHADLDPRRPDDTSYRFQGGQDRIYCIYYKIKDLLPRMSAPLSYTEKEARGFGLF
jgi:hypothetical protein